MSSCGRSASSSSWSSWWARRSPWLSGTYTLDDWAELVGRGLTLGSIYALIALGYTMVYGILRMINFAHGEIFMGGAFAGYFVAVPWSRSGCSPTTSADLDAGHR